MNVTIVDTNVQQGGNREVMVMKRSIYLLQQAGSRSWMTGEGRSR